MKIGDKLLQKSARARTIREFAGILGMRWYHVAIPIFLSLLISVTDAAGLGLLAPLARSVTSGDFSLTLGIPVVDDLLERVIGQVQGDARDVSKVFFLLAGSVLALNGLSTVFIYGNSLFGRYLQGIYKYRLQTAIYDRYFQFGKLYFDRVSQGYNKKLLEYASRVSDLVKATQDSLVSAARGIAYIVIMLWLSWRMLIFIALVFPILYVISRAIMKKVSKSWEESKQVSFELGRESFNIFSAMPLVWSYGQERTAQKKYAGMNETVRQAELKAFALGDLTGVIPRLFAIIILIGVVWFIATILAENPEQDITNYIVFLYVASQAMPMFKVFTNAWSAIAEMTPPVREIMRLFSDKRKYAVPSGNVKFSSLKESIEFRNLSFQYDNSPLLQGISIKVHRGQFVALVGPSGSGKSTIVSLLMRFYDCPPGTIFIDGIDVRSYNTLSLRQQIAYVDQEAILLNDTLIANITYGQPNATLKEVREAVKLAHLSTLVNRLPQGLETTIGDRGVQLSGGERQRVALARALVKGSDIILLDEATSSLDTITEKEVQEAIQGALRGKTAIVIAHRLSTVKQADTIIYMEEGKVCEQGMLQELLDQKGKFYKQWKLQSF